ncbi:uncharacterized protein Z518_08148 [Rhinocladiella mackenziei CBS 650.93]|uniref:Uncharacterized protein n=1 Tax=Rhinocladiella mackenziei CBS 650.93 TaxID=1442369 RepID=A0A0D2I8M6_9EURO|nr:uncharacterized protein Z518_08148 [Rhinocladiella mackenziei CBS 650.93]KIX02209.1 hypothetical protein Z518_08148 [Rhinocladiella mackenziei CBS 650.93]
MVLSLMVALITCPAMLATSEVIRQSQGKDKREEHRARRCNLVATCVKSSTRSREIDNRQIVLRNNKLYIDTGLSSYQKDDEPPFGHPFGGYYLPYPDTKYEGLVSTICESPPIMNWIYVDGATYEVKYGVRSDAQPNITGPFGCTRQDRRLTLEGWEGFVVVEEEDGLWALYYDRDDDGLKSKIAPGKRVLEVELWRREKRWKKDPVARQAEQAKQTS